jgi:methyl-accepting chemotaxis protein
MAVGFLIHPVAGFAAGFAGNVVGDALSGFGVWKFWNLQLANGFMGLIPGLLRYIGFVKVETVREFGILEMTVVLASAASVALAAVLDVFFLHFMSFPSSLHAWILPAFLTDAVNGFVIVPVILFAARRLLITVETRTILLITVLLATAVLSTAAAITGSVWDDLVSRAAMIETFYVAGIVSVVLLVLGFVASIGFVRRITDPLADLVRAAGKVEKGDYDLKELDAVSARADELGRLSRVLQEMASKVGERERKLKGQVRELQIEIDRKTQEREVAEIVETEYFQDLKKKAKRLRESRKTVSK